MNPMLMDSTSARNTMMMNQSLGGMTPAHGNSFLIGAQGTPMAPNTGVNPLYGAAPSPMNSQMGANAAMTSGLYGMNPVAAPGTATPTSPAGGNSVSEAEMLQQLMGEISRLKNELSGPSSLSRYMRL